MNINSVEDLVNKTNIRAFVNTTDLVKGKRYDPSKIELVEEREVPSVNGSVNYYHFEVDSESRNTYYDVSIYIKNCETIFRSSCDCVQYRNTSSCKHISAVFCNYYDMFFTNKTKPVVDKSEDILKRFLNVRKSTVKKELNVVLNITFNKEEYTYYYGTYTQVNPKVMIGENKLYVLGNHLNAFRSAYEDGSGVVTFGKNFTYNPREYYVSKESEVILNAYFEFMESNNSYSYNNKYKVKKFFNRLKDSPFIINNYQVDGIIEGFPILSNLVKNDDVYKLNFNLDSLEELVTDDYEYIFYLGKVYHLNQDEQELLEELVNEVDSVTITKDNLNMFTSGLLGVVKKGLTVDASVDDLVIPKDINAKLYFDLRDTYISVNVKFIYDTQEVEYGETNSNVLRDMDKENEIVNDILKYGFITEQDNIVLSDLEREVYFIENGLEQLATKYEVFTTEKFKGLNIKKKTSVSSMFSIGTDNILSYDFDLGDINKDELVNIFKSIKDRKKYYRLKNGDILSLEDENLQELSDLSEELELSDEEIIKGKGSLLKYRAIYLDSLKNTKYKIINTNNLFDEFIDKFYKYKDGDLTIDNLNVLRDYQVTGVKWLYNLSQTGFGGVLADEMGLGKTIQVIYYIKQILKDNPESKVLIVVPTSLAYNWDHEFASYGAEINRVICVGNKEKRINILENLDDINVVITTYGLVREDEDLYENLSFHTVVIDEAQNIKNNKAGITRCVKKLNADTKFALTGTPLENSILELWSIFDFIMPGYLSNITKFSHKYNIKDFDDDADKLLKGLSHQINPFILRRKKSDVVKELPEKLVNDIYIDLGTEQKKLYVAELEKVKQETEEAMKQGGMSQVRFMILPLLTKLRQLCIDPKIVYEDYEGGSNKLDRLIEIIEEYIKNGHKILIFSSFKTGLNSVREALNKEKIKSYTISGEVSAKKRMAMVDDFNENSEVSVFLLMLKAAGTGLNLASADVVIHLDLWWNPQAENQATDRAHRIGQKNTVEVIHLIMEGTIEEKILELQNKKRILAEKIIDGEVRDKNVLSELTKEDIENLLSYENRD